MKLIQVQDLFEVYNSQNLALNACIINEKSSYVLINRSEKNNGIAAKIENPVGEEPFPAGLMTVALSGSVLSTFIQTKPFFTSYHVATLKPKIKLSVRQMLYYKMCIEANKFRFNYGRQANRTLRFLEIPAPEEIPSWVETIELPQQMTGKAKSNEKVELPPVSEWKVFKYTDLFEITKCNSITAREARQKPGVVPYIGSTESNNGVVLYCSEKPTYPGNTITVATDGSIGSAFYQPEAYCANCHVAMFQLKNRDFSPSIALFLCTLIKMEGHKYSFGRAWGISRMKESFISLPVTSEGQPDYDLMERYINSLPYSANL